MLGLKQWVYQFPTVKKGNFMKLIKTLEILEKDLPLKNYFNENVDDNGINFKLTCSWKNGLNTNSHFIENSWMSC